MAYLRFLALIVLALSAFAFFPLGQVAASPGDAVADRVFGQAGSFTLNACNPGGVSASTLCHPNKVVDAAGNLYEVETSNSRVLVYNNPLVTDTVADWVFGQGGSFTSSTCNLGGITASSLCNPNGLALDAAGNLYVADNGNSRVLVYDNPLTTDAVADHVLGQPDFVTGICNSGGMSASSLCQPIGVTLDAAGNLYVADFISNMRVLEYDNPLATDSVADRVFGQPDFTSNACMPVSASSLCRPQGVAVDTAGSLYVTDAGNHRVLVYDTPLATDTVADRVFGQGGSFVSNTCNLGGISATSLCFPEGIALDAAGNLYVTEPPNNRVLEYANPLATDAVADRVLGQGGSFTSNTCNLGGISASSLCFPTDVALDAAGNLYVADFVNHRLLEYDGPFAGPPTPTTSASATPTTSASATPTSSASPTPPATPPPCAAGGLSISTGTGGPDPGGFGHLSDPNWIVAPGGSSGVSGAVVGIEPHPSWIPADPTTNWIDANATGGLVSDPGGSYLYETSFIVPAGAPNLVLDFDYAVDNDVVFSVIDTISNQYPIGFLSALPAEPSFHFNTLHHVQYVLPGPWPAGTYTLLAEVTNSAGTIANPVGLLVEGSVECGNAVVSGAVGGTVALSVSGAAAPFPSVPVAVIAVALAMFSVGFWYKRRRWLS